MLVSDTNWTQLFYWVFTFNVGLRDAASTLDSQSVSAELLFSFSYTDNSSALARDTTPVPNEPHRGLCYVFRM